MSSILENLKAKLARDFQASKQTLISEIEGRAESASSDIELLELAKRAYTQDVKSRMMSKFDSEMTVSEVKTLMDLSGSKSSADLLHFVSAWTRHDFLKVVATLQTLNGSMPRSSVAPATILPFVKAMMVEGKSTISRGDFVNAIGAHYRAKGKAAPTDLVNPFMSYLTLLHGGKKGIGLLSEHYMGRSIDHWSFGSKASKYLAS
jgi:hypothetical protein